MLLAFLEIFMIVLIAFFVVSQVIVPFLFKTPLFPLFRKRIILETELREVREEKETLAIEKEIAEIRETINKERNTPQ